MKLKFSWLTFVLIVLSVCVLGSCASSPEKEARKGMKNISYKDSGGDLELINETDFDLVVFAGKIRGNNILGGIRAGETRSFDFTPFISSSNGAFLVRAVKANEYEENNGNVSEADMVFAKTVTYGNGMKTSMRITGFVGGDGKLLFENSSPYPVEVRLNNVNGEVLTTLPPYCKEQYVYVKPNSRGYVYYPTYLMYDKKNGKMSSITPSDSDGIAARPVEGDKNPQVINFPMPNSNKFGSKVAYLTIRNESGRAFNLQNDNTDLVSQNGYVMINSGERLTYEVPSTEVGNVFRAIRADFRVGEESSRFVKFFEGNPTTLKAGVEYEINVFNDNGLVRAVIESSSDRTVDYNMAYQFELE